MLYFIQVKTTLEVPIILFLILLSGDSICLIIGLVKVAVWIKISGFNFFTTLSNWFKLYTFNLSLDKAKILCVLLALRISLAKLP